MTKDIFEISNIEQGNRQLFSLAETDASINESVCKYLQSNANLQAIVTHHGDCFVVPNPSHRRMIAHLMEVVRESGGSARKIPVSPIALAKWQEGHSSREISGSLGRRRNTNFKLQYVLEYAIDCNASDLYLDVGRTEAVISIKVWGYKRRMDSLPREQGLGLIRSMWALANTGHFEESAPCDCAFSFHHAGREYRVRGNSLPDVRGPHVVCRIRDPAFSLPLADCGYSPEQVALIARICAVPGGLILVTGETNSGKSTTMTSLMKQLPNTQKIIEIADPVEVQMDHVTHVELNRYHKDAAEMYARIQSAVVRQNPDTLVLGEIRDQVTANAASSMAIQGKRVYSTLHSQSCITAIPRLENIGIDFDLLCLREFLAGIINQNLVPLLCLHCALNEHPKPEQERRYRALFGSGMKHRNDAGCSHCHLGIVGRTLVAEVFPLGLDISGKPHKLIYERNYVGLENYMRTHWKATRKHEMAAIKIALGEIDPTETERIIGEFSAANTNTDAA